MIYNILHLSQTLVVIYTKPQSWPHDDIYFIELCDVYGQCSIYVCILLCGSIFQPLVDLEVVNNFSSLNLEKQLNYTFCFECLVSVQQQSATAIPSVAIRLSYEKSKTTCTTCLWVSVCRNTCQDTFVSVTDPQLPWNFSRLSYNSF